MGSKEEKLGRYKESHSGPSMGPHGRPRAGNGEKAKDLVGTWKKLLGYCRKYMAVFVIAMFCAAMGTVLMLIGPDKLSQMTEIGRAHV